MGQETAESESIENLHIPDLKLIQDSNAFKFGTDAVLLSHFASGIIRNKSCVLDLGCGNGIIPVLLSATSRAGKITGLEIQKKSAELAEKNAILNKIENIEIIQGDVKDCRTLFEGCSFNCVTTNPPYMKSTKGAPCKNESVNIARTEVSATLEDFIAGAAYCLKSNGDFVMINRPNRLSETLVLLEKHNFGARTLRFVCPFQDSEPSMFLIHAKKDFHPELKVCKNLVISNSDGTYTKELFEIYGGTSLGANFRYSN